MIYLVWLKKRGEKGRWEYVRSLLAASRAVRAFITDHPDGPIGSEWEDGRVKTIGWTDAAGKEIKVKTVAHISYNGRIWEPGENGSEIRIPEDEILWDRFHETGDFTPLAMLADWMDERGIRPASAQMIRDAAIAKKPAVYFFFINAGTGYDPAKETFDEGSLSGAVDLAAAEEWLEEVGGEYEWVVDDDYTPDEPNTAWGCIARVPKEGEPAPGHRGPFVEHTSLWGITFAADDDTPWEGTDGGRYLSMAKRLKPYALVVQAELALELMREHQ